MIQPRSDHVLGFVGSFLFLFLSSEGHNMFKILGPGVYRRRNDEVIEIERYREGVSVNGPIWIKKGSGYSGDRTQMAWLDSFVECGRVDAFQAGPFDLVECIKLVCTPEADHMHGCPSPDASASLPPGYEANVIESQSERLGPRLRYRGAILINDSIKIEDAVQFVIQKCGIPKVTDALILAKNQKVAFLKLFEQAVSQTVKRGINSDVDVTVTFL